MFKASSIEDISRFKKQLMKRCIENALKIHVIFGIVFIKNPTKFDQKIRSRKAYPTNIQNLDFSNVLASQNPSKIHNKSTKINIKNKGGKIRRNERQERPRPLQERCVESAYMEYPLAPLSSS